MAPDDSPPLDGLPDRSTTAALEAASLAEARGRPAGVCTSEGFFALEQRRPAPSPHDRVSHMRNFQGETT